MPPPPPLIDAAAFCHVALRLRRRYCLYEAHASAPFFASRRLRYAWLRRADTPVRDAAMSMLRDTLPSSCPPTLSVYVIRQRHAATLPSSRYSA